MKNTQIFGANIRTEQIKLKPIDEGSLENVGFIKIDVEGNEYKVIKSIENIIEKYKPIVAIELNHENPDKTEILNFLNQKGYNTFLISNPLC